MNNNPDDKNNKYTEILNFSSEELMDKGEATPDDFLNATEALENYSDAELDAAENSSIKDGFNGVITSDGAIYEFSDEDDYDILFQIDSEKNGEMDEDEKILKELEQQYNEYIEEILGDITPLELSEKAESDAEAEAAAARVKEITEREKTIEQMDEYEQAAARKKTYTKQNGEEIVLHNKFFGVDGEGYWDTEKYCHIYDMLTIGEKTVGTPGVSLMPLDIFKAFFDHQAEQRELGFEPVYQIFFGVYDFTQWIAGMNDSAKRNMCHMNNAEDGRNHYNDLTKFSSYYKMNYKPRKKFTIVEYDDNDKIQEISRINIFDCCTNFSTSFVKVVNSVLSDEEYTAEQRAIIEDGKADRNKKYSAEDRVKDWDTVVEYNKLECSLLAIVCDKICREMREIFKDNNINFLCGSGDLAKKWLNKIGDSLAISSELVDSYGLENYSWINDAYFGGLFETFMFGLIKKKVYEYDINSAYPFILADLPDLRGSVLKNYARDWDTPENKELYGEGTIIIEFDEDFMQTMKELHQAGNPVFLEGHITSRSRVFGAANVRDYNQCVFRPGSGNVRIEMGEFLAAEESGLIEDFIPYEAKVVMIDETVKDSKPFSGIADLYTERLVVGKNTVRGIALKTTYNSVYGKICQKVGAFKFANPVYAALATAGCRAQIIRAIATVPDWEEHLVMISTDAVFFDVPNPALSLSNKLGDWEEKVFEDGMWIVKNGIYGELNKDGEMSSTMLRSRGVHANQLRQKLSSEIIPLLENFTEEGCWDLDATVEIEKDFFFYTTGMARREQDYSLVGLVVPNVKTEIRFETGKRIITSQREDGVFMSEYNVVASRGGGICAEIVQREGLIGFNNRASEFFQNPETMSDFD